MCTIVVLLGAHPDYPLVLATNRDEFYARPASGAVRLLDRPAAVGGRDLQVGGTWMGVTEAGFFAGVTNQAGYFGRRPDTRSRGELVMDVLRAGGTREARRQLERVHPSDYNDFNLLFGDAESLWAAYGRDGEDALRFEAVPPGLHVLPNGRLDSADFPKVQRVRTLLEGRLEAPWPELSSVLRDALADGHTTPQRAPDDAPTFFDDELMRQLSALCVRTPAYGTRSSTLVALQPGRCAHYLYADGPPDRTPFEDVTGLFSRA